jgi:heterodisulfide reductase subunit C2
VTGREGGPRYYFAEEQIFTMPVRITKGTSDKGIMSAVEEMSGVAVDACLQCRRCTNGCPVSSYTASSPSEIIKQLQLGAGDRLLDSEMIWSCVSCETCFARCPMKINMAEVMDAMKMLAREREAKKPDGNAPLMNRILLGTMKTFGRTYDLAAMMFYKAGSGTYLRDTGKFPMILKKGKIALFPPRGADKKQVKRIFKYFMKARNK